MKKADKAAQAILAHLDSVEAEGNRMLDDARKLEPDNPSRAEMNNRLIDRGIIELRNKRIAELEAALADLLKATSDSAVMYPSQRDIWVKAEAALTKSDGN